MTAVQGYFMAFMHFVEEFVLCSWKTRIMGDMYE
jgi:hypothetical protein